MSKIAKQDIARLIELVGGKENIASVSHCLTRLRFVLNETEQWLYCCADGLKGWIPRAYVEETQDTEWQDVRIAHRGREVSFWLLLAWSTSKLRFEARNRQLPFPAQTCFAGGCTLQQPGRVFWPVCHHWDSPRDAI